MRRSDREIKNLEKIEEIIKGCMVCRLGMYDKENSEVYIVPLNFGYDLSEGTLTIYCHSAGEGRKIELLSKNKKVCIEMDCNHMLLEAEKACGYSYSYSSIIGSGEAEFIDSFEEKAAAFNKLMLHQTGKEFEFNKNMIDAAKIIKITVKSFSCKEKN